ncbi:hypothetical protein FD09_GL001746 [Schleiferilactobacillus perolens DSM 12744]|uniref:Uncharacterized protein n=1 Tax=Schleiferilactobacillus perolens DSM 12744 TaxID=1423792 RepID=A0A0R1N075_9LACO|nr:hypothetical protein FD09_GL001746 [Schleiferilactobacillus perolens DSM 12744]
MIVLSGCELPGQFVGKNSFAEGTSASGHHISAKESSAKKPSNQTKAVAYSDLPTKVTRNIHFTFKADQDETADSNAGAVYIITMTVVNGSSVPIIFDSSKFQIIAPDWSERQRTAQSGTIRLKPGSKATINNLFTKVSRQSLSGSGIFVYLTWQHPLAYVYKCFESGGVSSDNLGDTKLIKMNTPKQADSASSSSSSDNNPSANTDDTDDDADDTSDTSSSGTVDMKNLTQAQLLDWVRADLASKGLQVDRDNILLTPGFEDGYAIVHVDTPRTQSSGISWHTVYRVNSDGELEVSTGNDSYTVVSTPFPDD